MAKRGRPKGSKNRKLEHTYGVKPACACGSTDLKSRRELRRWPYNLRFKDGQLYGEMTLIHYDCSKCGTRVISHEPDGRIEEAPASAPERLTCPLCRQDFEPHQMSAPVGDGIPRVCRTCAERVAAAKR